MYLAVTSTIQHDDTIILALLLVQSSVFLWSIHIGDRTWWRLPTVPALGRQAGGPQWEVGTTQ